MTIELEVLRAQLATARGRYATLKETMDHRRNEAEKAFQAANEELLVEHDRWKQQLAEVESTAREALVDHYIKTGEKKPVEGLTIAEYDVVDYVEAEALAWAKAKGIDRLIKLSTSDFERAAKSGLFNDIPASVRKEPRPRIATNLSQWGEV